MSEGPGPAISAFVTAWKDAFSKVLTQLGASNVAVSETPGSSLQPASEKNTNSISAVFSGGGCLEGQLLWTCEKTVAIQCAQLLMSEPVDGAAEFTETHGDGFLEFLRQVAGEAALAWKEKQGLPTELVYQTAPPAEVTAQFTFTLTIESENCKGLALRLDLDEEFCTALAAPPPEHAPAQVQGENAASPAGDSSESQVSNLDLILDVQLEAAIRFGEREMFLQDVLGLTPGAVVELDQLVNEPAELLVAGRLVAKGDVVVVDGNFGLRVTEVASRHQRAEMLSLE
jgi:flagellar motor switch protein FliN/FliY